VTEELWETLGYKSGERSLIAETWPDLPAGAGDAAAQEEMNWVVEAISAVRALRAEMNVPQGAKLALLFRDAGATARARLDRHAGLIRTLARVETISAETGGATKGAAPIVVADATLVLPLAGVIDAAAERKRLEKEIVRHDGDIEKIGRKLSNADFVAKADPEAVEDQRDRLREAEAARKRLSASLALLAEI
jgi:valyl-tRNA synthetase